MTLELRPNDVALNLGVDPLLDLSVFLAEHPTKDRREQEVAVSVILEIEVEDGKAAENLDDYLERLSRSAPLHERPPESLTEIVVRPRFLTSDSGLFVPLSEDLAKSRDGLKTLGHSDHDEPPGAAALAKAKRLQISADILLRAKGGAFTAPAALLRQLLEKARKESLLGGIEVVPRVRPQLLYARPSVHASRNELPDLPQGQPLNGEEVVIGLVDFGFDFAHPHFRKRDGSAATRLLVLWDQNAAGPNSARAPAPRNLGNGDPAAEGFGREFSREMIDAALATPGATPYASLGYDPHDNYYLDSVAPGAHGTFVADVAAGNGSIYYPDEEQPGIAPAADLIFVQMRMRDGPSGSRALLADDLLAAVRYIFDRAGNRPAVVNISLNTNLGSRDGDSYFARKLNLLLEQSSGGPGRAIVIAAGNFRGQDIHVRGRVTAARPAQLLWEFQEGDSTLNQMEIWYDADGHRLALELYDSSGTLLGRVEPETSATLISPGSAEPGIGLLVGSRYRPPEETALSGSLAAGAAQGRQVILLALRPEPGLEGLQIRLLFSAADGPPRQARPVIFDAWVERDDYQPATAIPTQSRVRLLEGALPQQGQPDANESYTLGTFSCAAQPFVVAAYAAVGGGNMPFFAGSAGPTRINEEKPDLSAPGQAVRAARSKPTGDGSWPPPKNWESSQATAVLSGTSLAAPFVTGAIALLFQVKRDATHKQLSDALLATLSSSGRRRRWSPLFGGGRLNVAAAVARMRQTAGGRP